MGIIIQKGQKTDVTKNNKNIKKFTIGLGWDTRSEFDIDAAAFILNSNGKTDSDNEFVFYNNDNWGNGAVIHRRESGAADKEEIKIEIEGAPQGTTLAAYVNNAADGIYPLQKDHEGNFGRATSGNKNIVFIPKALAINGTISTDNIRLMPTVAEATKANSANSNLSFLFTLSDGTIIECNAQAPIMRSSGKYKIKMKYSQL